MDKMREALNNCYKMERIPVDHPSGSRHVIEQSYFDFELALSEIKRIRLEELPESKSEGILINSYIQGACAGWNKAITEARKYIEEEA